MQGPSMPYMTKRIKFFLGKIVPTILLDDPGVYKVNIIGDLYLTKYPKYDTEYNVCTNITLLSGEEIKLYEQSFIWNDQYIYKYLLSRNSRTHTILYTYSGKTDDGFHYYNEGHI